MRALLVVAHRQLGQRLKRTVCTVKPTISLLRTCHQELDEVIVESMKGMQVLMCTEVYLLRPCLWNDLRVEEVVSRESINSARIRGRGESQNKNSGGDGRWMGLRQTLSLKESFRVEGKLEPNRGPL